MKNVNEDIKGLIGEYNIGDELGDLNDVFRSGDYIIIPKENFKFLVDEITEYFMELLDIVMYVS